MFKHTAEELARVRGRAEWLSRAVHATADAEYTAEYERLRQRVCSAYMKDVGERVSEAEVLRYCTLEFFEQQVRRHGTAPRPPHRGIYPRQDLVRYVPVQPMAIAYEPEPPFFYPDPAEADREADYQCGDRE